MKKEKPFYLREPWEILFKDTKLSKISPWKIDLVYLLTTLLEEMTKVGIDFRMAGTAINSSVLIYLKKAELLFKIEETESVENKSDVYIPPPLPLPFRFEFTTTSVTDLLEALEKALDEESRRKPRSKLPVLPMPIPDLMDFEVYLLEIEERSDDLFVKIQEIYGYKSTLSIFDLIDENERLNIIKVFMMLLFLAQRGKIDLNQEEDETDIKIEIIENGYNE